MIGCARKFWFLLWRAWNISFALSMIIGSIDSVTMIIEERTHAFFPIIGLSIFPSADDSSVESATSIKRNENANKSMRRKPSNSPICQLVDVIACDNPETATKMAKKGAFTKLWKIVLLKRMDASTKRAP